MNQPESITIYKGNIIFTPTIDRFEIVLGGYIVVRDGIIENVYQALPLEYKNEELVDYQDKLIIPGMNDLHCHASQFRHLGMAMDKELLPWLDDYTFPEEARFQDLEYSKKVYQRFIHEIWKQGTTRIAVFATIHKESTIQLIKLFQESGLGALVGKVNMDRNCPPFLCEETETSLTDSEEILIHYGGNSSSLVRPIITPRFVPNCSSALLEGLGQLCVRYNIPCQSHLSENKAEIKWVKELHPHSNFYGEVYHQYNLFGQTPTLMAHCSFSSRDEMALMKANGVMAVHCPSSNLNVGSGMMPIRNFLHEGIPLGFGSDISGGHTCSLFKTMIHAIQVSKLFWANTDQQMDFLTNAEAFYIATKGGGSFFGKVGSFEAGYDFDALVIDDSNLNPSEYSLAERLERFIYTGDDRHILHRYVKGRLVNEPFAHV